MTDQLDDLWKFLRLTEDEEDDIKTTDTTEDSAAEEGKNWLVGKLLTTRPFNKDAMMATMKSISKLHREVEIAFLEDNLFLFKFQGGKDKERVMEGAAWSFDKHMLIFHEYKGDWRPEEYIFQKASFWIRVYNLPLGMRSKSIAERIGQRMGNLLLLTNA
ncbi:hypothetical protein DITRI_Ditri02bG0156200 [Diplodiscus trichospermus]